MKCIKGHNLPSGDAYCHICGAPPATKSLVKRVKVQKDAAGKNSLAALVVANSALKLACEIALEFLESNHPKDQIARIRILKDALKTTEEL